jgi:four helix bundle protein
MERKAVKIERFEDIQAWQEARRLANEVYQATSKLPFRRDIGLRRQIQEASVSVMANVAEGFDRQSRKEFVQFLYYASSSASEVQSHLYVALDQQYVSERDFSILYEQAKSAKSLINGFIAYLKRHK